MYKDKEWLQDQHCILGKTVRQIAEECGVNPKTVSYYKEKFGIKTPRAVRYSGVTKYHTNHDFFSSIDTEGKAYWLGYIVADGCVTEEACNTKRLSFCIMEDDKLHLEKLKIDLCSTAPVKFRIAKLYHRGEYPQAILRINSTRLCDDLIAMGVTPNKSTKEKYPIGIPEELERHFWRGVFDGDGCISIYETKDRTVAQVSLIGSEEIIQRFYEFASHHVSFRAKPLLQGRNHMLTLSGWNASALCKVLYMDATVVLDRKNDLYNQLLDLYKEDIV